jgi:hypothetical protein
MKMFSHMFQCGIESEISCKMGLFSFLNLCCGQAAVDVTNSVFVTENVPVPVTSLPGRRENVKMFLLDLEYPRVVRNAQTRIWELKNSCVVF